MAFQTQYSGMWCVDVHTHMARQHMPNQDGVLPNSPDVFGEWINLLRPAIMNECGIDAAFFVDLDGGKLDARWYHNAAEGAATVAALGQGRILATLGDYRPAKGLYSVTPDQIAATKANGYVGYKWHWNSDFNSPAKYCLIDNPYFRPWLEAMEDARLPLFALHMEAPCGDPQAQDLALANILALYPQMTVMRAHFGHNRRLTLKQIAGMLDAHPNYYYDTSASTQHYTCWSDWNYTAFRDFCIKYSDRILFGTDAMGDVGGIAVNRLAGKYVKQLEFWETDNLISVTRPSFGCTSLPDTFDIKGMKLPRAALENIYYKNACRLFPEIRALALAKGYACEGVAPPPPQEYKFTVTATDAAGRTSKQVITATVKS